MNTISLKPETITHNLNVLSGLKKGDKLIYDKNSFTINVEERTWFLTARRYFYGFQAEVVEKTMVNALKVMRESYLNKDIDAESKKMAETCNRLFDTALMGLLNLVETYRGESKDKTAVNLQEIYNNCLRDFHTVRVPLPPPLPTSLNKKITLAADKENYVEKLVKKLNLGTPLTYCLQNDESFARQLQKRRKRLEGSEKSTFKMPEYVAPAIQTVKKMHVPKPILQLSEKALRIRSMMGRKNPAMKKDAFVNDLAKSLQIRSQKEPVDLSEKLQKLEEKKPVKPLQHPLLNIKIKQIEAPVNGSVG